MASPLSKACGTGHTVSANYQCAQAQPGLRLVPGTAITSTTWRKSNPSLRQHLDMPDYEHVRPAAWKLSLLPNRSGQAPARFIVGFDKRAATGDGIGGSSQRHHAAAMAARRLPGPFVQCAGAARRKCRQVADMNCAARICGQVSKPSGDAAARKSPRNPGRTEPTAHALQAQQRSLKKNSTRAFTSGQHAAYSIWWLKKRLSEQDYHQTRPLVQVSSAIVSCRSSRGMQHNAGARARGSSVT